jgi:hypothetical protein
MHSSVVTGYISEIYLKVMETSEEVGTALTPLEAEI